MPKVSGSVVELVESMRQDRVAVDAIRQDIADNLLGRRDFITRRISQENRHSRIFDDTAKVSGSLLAGAIHSLLTNPSAKWFSLVFEDPSMEDIPGSLKWLELVEKRIYSAIGAPGANFHAQLSEVYIDLIYFGMGAMFIHDEVGSGVRFSARPLSEVYVMNDDFGRPMTIARMMQLTARQAASMFGEADEVAIKMVKSGRQMEKIGYTHLIQKNDEFIAGNLDKSGKPWSSVIFADETKMIVSDGGYHELPMALPRWEKDAGESYPTGAGWKALSDQKMLNQMKKTVLQAAQKSVSPAYMVDSEGVFPADVSFHPNSLIPVNTALSNMNPPIQPVPSASNFSITQALIEDTRKSVQNAFHHQLVETIRDPRMTATQVMELSAQIQRHLAPILGRMQTEMLEPIIDRVYAIESRANRLPEPPREIQGVPIRISYTSPIARAQQTSDARAIIDFLGFVANVSQVYPDVQDLLDTDVAMRELAVSMGVPRSAIRDELSVQRIREANRQIAAEQQQQQQLDQGIQQASGIQEIIKNVSPQ